MRFTKNGFVLRDHGDVVAGKATLLESTPEPATPSRSDGPSHDRPSTPAAQKEPVPEPKQEEKPDVSLALVDISSVAVLVVNAGDMVVRDPKYSLLLWNLDLPDRQDPLPIPVTGLKDWVRPHENLGPQAAISLPTVQPLVQLGNRLLGYMSVSCPDCKRTKYYWVYVVAGQHGWYSELPDGKYPATNGLFRLIPGIRQRSDAESFFDDIPQASRIPIVDMP